MNVTIRQLRIFIEVAERRSIVHAATVLHLTPPAVSMQIKELEAQVGLPLFDRNNKQLSLTVAGEYLVIYAKRLLANLKEAENAFARLKGLDRGSLTVGIVSTAAYFMPRLLTRFHNEHPGIEVRLRVVYNHEQSVALMEDGQADLMVITRPLKELVASVDIFADNPLVFVCPPGHPFLKQEPLAPKTLDDCVFITREQGTRARDMFETFLARHQCTPRITMELPSNETIKQAVIAGMGLSFLSLQTIGLELRHGLLRVLDIADTPIVDTWHIAHLPSKILSPAAEAFRYFVMEEGKADIRAHNSELLALAFKNRATLGNL